MLFLSHFSEGECMEPERQKELGGSAQERDWGLAAGKQWHSHNDSMLGSALSTLFTWP